VVTNSFAILTANASDLARLTAMPTEKPDIPNISDEIHYFTRKGAFDKNYLLENLRS
jgi:hypothetical protein